MGKQMICQLETRSLRVITHAPESSEGWVVEIEDGGDTVEWCATQPWSNGQVGMMGMSHMGLTQWKAAQNGSRYLKAIAPQMGPADEYLYGMNYTGGAFLLQIGIPWSISVRGRTMQTRKPYDWEALFRHLPILTADEKATGKPIGFYRDWIRHAAYDEFWERPATTGISNRWTFPSYRSAAGSISTSNPCLPTTRPFKQTEPNEPEGCRRSWSDPGSTPTGPSPSTECWTLG